MHGQLIPGKLNRYGLSAPSLKLKP